MCNVQKKQPSNLWRVSGGRCNFVFKLYARLMGGLLIYSIWNSWNTKTHFVITVYSSSLMLCDYIIRPSSLENVCVQRTKELTILSLRVFVGYISVMWLYVGFLWSLQGADDMWDSDGDGRARCSSLAYERRRRQSPMWNSVKWKERYRKS